MRTAWLARAVLAVCVVVSGVVHYKLYLNGQRNIPVIGPAFLVNAVAGVVIGVLLLTWRSWFPLFLAFGFGLVTLAAFVVATSPLGLFGARAHWSGWAEWTCAITEAVAVVVGVAALLAERRPASRALA